MKPIFSLWNLEVIFIPHPREIYAQQTVENESEGDYSSIVHDFLRTSWTMIININFDTDCNISAIDRLFDFSGSENLQAFGDYYFYKEGIPTGSKNSNYKSYKITFNLKDDFKKEEESAFLKDEIILEDLRRIVDTCRQFSNFIEIAAEKTVEIELEPKDPEEEILYNVFNSILTEDERLLIEIKAL